MSLYDSTTVYDAASLTYDGNTPGLANLPVVGVFIAFDDGPYVADPDWVEVTDYVREVAIRRGRQDDLQQFPAGSAQVVLDNRDRLFDPFNDQVVQRTNLVTNPSFETGTTNWTAINAASLAQSTTISYTGSASMQITTGASINGGAATITDPPVTVGTTYTASCYARSLTGSLSGVVIFVLWLNSSGVEISRMTGAAETVTTDWKRLSISGTAPAGAVTAEIRVRYNPNAAGTVYFVDGFLFEQSATVGDYFDGDTLSTGSPGVGRTSWTGTAHASTSTLVNFPNGSYLKPRRQIKIVGQWAGVNYPLFRGFVAGWPVEYSDGGKDSTVTIDCFDALGLMANEVVTTDWVGEYTRSLNPIHYWRCDESQPLTSIGDSIGAWPIVVNPSVAQIRTFENSPLGIGLSANSIFAPYWGYSATNPAAYSGNLTFSGWVQLSTYDEAFVVSFVAATLGGQRITLGKVPGSSSIRVQGRSRQGATEYIRLADFAPPFGALTTPFHFAITTTYNAAAAPTLQIYLNGTLFSPTTSTSSTASGTLLDELQITYAAVQELTLFDRVLSATEIGNLYNYGSARFPETTSARMTRLRDTTDYRAALTSFTGSPVASVSEIGSTTVVAEFQNVVSSENGELFVDSAGILTFLDRYGWANRTRSNTSQVTFTDTGTGVYYDASSVRIDINADQVRNDSTVISSSGSQSNAINDASVSEFGAASENISTYLSDPAQAETLAEYRVSIYGQPKIRVEPFLVKGQRDPGYAWPLLLNLDLLDRFTFVRTPDVGSAISKPMLLQSIEHRFTPGTWETIINGSARYTGWFVLDSSLLDGEDVLL